VRSVSCERERSKNKVENYGTTKAEEEEDNKKK
jgi:hypothetical protein